MQNRDAPRIIQVGVDCVPSSGGTYTLMNDFRHALQAPIISVTARGFLPEGDDDGVMHVPVGAGRLAQSYRVPARSHPRTREALRHLRSADLIIIHGLFRAPTGWASRIAQEQGTPFVVVPHGSLDPWVFTYRSFRKRLWMSLVGRRLLRDAHCVVVASPLEDRKAGQVVDSKCRRVVIPWPVPPHRPSSDGGRRVRETLGIGADSRVLVTLGRLHPAKGVAELIRAVGAAAPDLHLVVVGPESLELTRAECVEIAARFAPGRVHLVGPAWAHERSAYFDGADAFITLSHRESFGYAVGEAMAAGLPVIVSSEAGIASALDLSACGWLLRAGAGEAEAVAAIRSFLGAAPHDLAVLGSAARTIAARELSFDRFQACLRGELSRTLPGFSPPVDRPEDWRKRPTEARGPAAERRVPPPV